MKINEKTIALKKFFTENDMNMFESENLNDEAETTILRSRIKIDGQLLPIAILIDCTNYILIQVQIIPDVVTDDTFADVMNCLNEYNNRFRLFKFTISESGDVLFNATLTFVNNTFDPLFLNKVLAEIVKLLNTEYFELANKIGFYTGNVSEESIRNENNDESDNDNLGRNLTHFAGHIAVKLLKDFLLG